VSPARLRTEAWVGSGAAALSGLCQVRLSGWARRQEEIEMALRRKHAIVAAAVLGMGAGGFGIAQAVSSEAKKVSAAGAVRVAQTPGDDSDERVGGPEAERAERAAVDAVGGGRVVSVEREDEAGVAWEVEMVQRDGREVEVDLNSSLEQVAIDRADDDAEDEPETADDDGATEVREGRDDD
jgi:hypothetical protein